ncbi:RNA-guided endonuclease InsQ/TnpB family protein [Methanosarcina sp. UBA5]|uniref:RNA-guided endonuclease InsQ/TnpB family protein n=1 Tax=Methanosarcina sp. UBA5 TaxID=1915593 RepID=UPI0025E44D7D|nr:transposase [Methanosarcina sp. UBA5]
MPKLYRYRIYPTHSQVTKLNETLELCRWVYNETLALRKNAWESEQKRISYYDSKKIIPVWKKDKPELKTVHSHTLQDVTMRVDLAFQAFFRRVKAGENPGYPRFKGKGWYDSITYLQSGFSLNENILTLSKIGDIKIKMHRPLEGNIKRLTIRRTSTQKWFVSILTDVDSYQPLEHSDKAVGIDVGILSFATLSNGTYVPNPRFYIQEEKALAKANRKFSKAEKGTPERKKCLKTLCRVYERIANKREDFTQKLSKKLVDNYGIVCFEDLNINNMTKNHNLAKHILDAAWSKLVTYTSYKAENAGRKVILVDPKNTSKMCSNCGMLVEKSLSERTHNCPFCGLFIDRDLNASINILRLGLQSDRKIGRCPSLQRGE